MSALDPRLTPARADLAAKHLEGKVAAARFVEGELREVAEPQAPLRRAPSPDAALDTEALKGERVIVYETTDEGWARAVPRPPIRSQRYAPWCFQDPRSSCRRSKPSRSVAGLRSRASKRRSW